MTFTKKQICDKTGLKPRQVQFLTEEGIIEPTNLDKVVRGGNREYSEENLFFFAVAKELMDLTISKETIRKIFSTSHFTEKPFKDILFSFSQPQAKMANYLYISVINGEIEVQASFGEKRPPFTARSDRSIEKRNEWLDEDTTLLPALVAVINLTRLSQKLF